MKITETRFDDLLEAGLIAGKKAGRKVTWATCEQRAAAEIILRDGGVESDVMSTVLDELEEMVFNPNAMQNWLRNAGLMPKVMDESTKSKADLIREKLANIK